MTKLYTNPNRKNSSIEKYEQQLIDDPNDEEAKQMILYYQDWDTDKRVNEQNPKWKEYNLEYDLRTSEYIRNKCLASDGYAQNLYSALCNNEFRKNEVIPILTEERWGCSWRYAGGILADILERGDYIDWYLSGMIYDSDDVLLNNFVNEGEVTDEIRNDLLQLNWIVCVDNDRIR